MTATTQSAVIVSARGKYDGLSEILNYNRRFYALTLLGAAAGIISAAFLPATLAWFLVGATAVAAGWILVSLLVSHYIYDRSQLYDLRWMRGLLSHAPRNWVNIHNGLDQTSEILRSVFPDSSGRILDVYDPKEMTEPSITRAREVSHSAPPAQPADFRKLPLADSSCDAVFLLFAAHEIRKRNSRAEFFCEIARVLAADGSAVLVEHLRDAANFAAFGPGFLHFQSRKEWFRAAASAKLKLQYEMTITPFVHVFVLVHDYDH